MIKRAVDVGLSAAGLVLLAPVLVGISAAIWISSGRPIFFVQERVGRRFRRFRLYKFRSMAPAAGGPGVTVYGDRRITSIGRVLRSTKLDELPQLWNVFIGDMSLVGPRPELPQYVEMFKADYDVLLQVRPGITDLASICFRDEERVLAAASDPAALYVTRILPTKIRLSRRYIRRRSLLADIKILVSTLKECCCAGEHHAHL